MEFHHEIISTKNISITLFLWNIFSIFQRLLQYNKIYMVPGTKYASV